MNWVNPNFETATLNSEKVSLNSGRVSPTEGGCPVHWKTGLRVAEYYWASREESAYSEWAWSRRRPPSRRNQ